MKPEDELTVRVQILLCAVAMGEAVVEEDFDELRFLVHLMTSYLDHCDPPLGAMREAALALARLLGPLGTPPDDDYGVALCKVTALVERECVGLETGNRMRAP